MTDVHDDDPRVERLATLLELPPGARPPDEELDGLVRTAEAVDEAWSAVPVPAEARERTAERVLSGRGARPARAPWRRPWVRRIGAVVAVAAVLAGGVVVYEAVTGGGAPGSAEIVARAEAAIDPSDAIVHTRARLHAETVIRPQGADEIRQTLDQVTESWALGSRTHSIVRSPDGEVLYDITSAPGTTSVWDASTNTTTITDGLPQTPTGQPVRGLEGLARILQAAEVLGPEDYEGQEVWRLVTRCTSTIGESDTERLTEYRIDTSTYAPVALDTELETDAAGTTSSSTSSLRYELFEQLPPGETALLELLPHPDARVVRQTLPPQDPATTPQIQETCEPGA